MQIIYKVYNNFKFISVFKILKFQKPTRNGQLKMWMGAHERGMYTVQLVHDVHTR